MLASNGPVLSLLDGLCFHCAQIAALSDKLLEPAPLEEKENGLSISWSQSDYDKIANRIYDSVWNESLDNWNLYRLTLGVNCQDNLRGFDYADYVYFKEVVANGKTLYTARDIFITPQYDDITVGSDTNFPHPFFGWKHIDTGIIQVNAENALQLAENSGGREVRLSVQNKCRIYVGMNPEGFGHNDWVVNYGGNSEMKDFEVIIPAKK